MGDPRIKQSWMMWFCHALACAFVKALRRSSSPTIPMIDTLGPTESDGHHGKMTPPSQPRLTRLHLEALIVPARRTLPPCRHPRMEKRIIAVPLQMWSTLMQIRQAAGRIHNSVTIPYQLGGGVCGGRPIPFQCLPTRLNLYNQGPVRWPSVAIAVTVTLLERSQASPQELLPRRNPFMSRDLTLNPKYHVM
jgi:hypothetical protein